MLPRGGLYLCAGPRQIWVLAWAAGRPEGLCWVARLHRGGVGSSPLAGSVALELFPNPLAPMLLRGSLYLCVRGSHILDSVWAARRPEGLMLAANQVSPCWASQDFCVAKSLSTLKATPLFGRQADCPARPVKRWAWQRLGASASDKFAPLFHLLTGCSAAQRGYGSVPFANFGVLRLLLNALAPMLPRGSLYLYITA